VALILHCTVFAGLPRHRTSEDPIMASTQTGKSRSGARKAPPAVVAAKPVAAPKAKKIAVKSTGPVIGSQEWNAMVATAAYFRAEARGFTGGSAELDWAEAEAELMAKFATVKAKAPAKKK
jgi:hypothetical protein